MKSDREIASALGKLARQRADAEVADTPEDAGRARFVSTVARLRDEDARHASSRARRAPSIRFGRAISLLAAAAILVAAVLFVATRSKSSVEFVVEGAPVASGGYVQTAPLGSATVRFSDGSVITLASSSAGRVIDRRPRGASFSLERGHALVHVAKRDGGADYVFDAGPYSVKVTGTRFDLGWDPATQAMRLDLEEGSVVVSGPEAESGVTMHAGQTIEVSPTKGLHLSSAATSALDPRTAIGPSSSAVAEEHASSPSADTPREGAPSAAADAASSASKLPAAREDTPRRGWAERVAAGDFSGVLADADARGVDTVLGTASLGDLMALADAARYGGRSGLASQALKSVRARFAGTKAASTAAFLLGRMAEDGGNVDGALRLYETAMAEGSTFSAEALGHRMLLVKRTKGDSAARPLAEQYLKSYPRGPYADAARGLTDL